MPWLIEKVDSVFIFQLGKAARNISKLHMEYGTIWTILDTNKSYSSTSVKFLIRWKMQIEFYYLLQKDP